MATDAKRAPARFQPERYAAFRFVSCSLERDGNVVLGYALDEEIDFTERLQLPVAAPLTDDALERGQGLLSLLHWVAGVSYFKTAVPPRVVCETGAPPAAAAALLEALYSEGLGEFAFTNGLRDLPRPRFASDSHATPVAPAPASARGVAPDPPRRVLVPVGGGKDSIVALELVRSVGVELALFSLGDAPPIARTVAAAGLPRLLARRTLDPELADLNRAGALNGHVPVTAIVACAALLSASLNGFDAVAMANERSASSGNVTWHGIEVNHQFSKGMRVERLLARAAAEAAGPQLFSVLRPASELAIARAFARMERYHSAFTSCNASFRIDPQLRATSWCCECPKCRFVYLALAPFSDPARLRAIFGRDLLDEESQYEGFALLTATGGHKPFECVGEEQESLAAIRLLAADPRWRGQRVLERLVVDVLARQPAHAGDPALVLALSHEHAVPAIFLPQLDALLGA
jgi:hypothetical protein